ncbi:MAG: hypothetical protein WCK86_01870 [Planctomycetia bacterium]
MLRAFGIAFIACSLMLLGMTVGGLSWWLISSGVVQIRGVNDRDAAKADAERHFDQESMLAEQEDDDAADPRTETQERRTGRVRVRTASYQAAAADPAPEALKSFRLVSVEGVDGAGGPTIAWDSPLDGTLFFPANVSKVTMKFEGSKASQLKPAENNESLKSAFVVGGTSASTVKVETQDSGTVITATFTLSTPAGGIMRSGIKGDDGGPASTTIVIPTASQSLISVSTGKYAPAPASRANPLPLYDDYLRLDFAEAASSGNVQYFVSRVGSKQTRQVQPSSAMAFDNNGKPSTAVKTSVELNDRGDFDNWDVADKAVVFWVTQNSQQQFVGSNAIVVQRSQSSDENSATISPLQFVEGGSKKTKRIGDMVYSLPAAQVNATVSGAPTDSRLVLRNGAGAPLSVKESTSSFDSGIITLPAGPQTLRLDLYQGNRIIASAKAQQVTVLEHGPSAPTVDATGFTLQDNGVIRLKFESGNPLDETAAALKDNYELKSTDATATMKQPRLDPRYDSATGILELSFSKDLDPGDYVLTVKPALTNILGQNFQSLAVQGGKPFSVNVTKSTAAGVPLESRGLSGLTGDSPEYPEYTNPRTYSAGFNPSDKVVARMVRMHYFRDAHRVVQLINRKAQSYNRAAVDMKEQFADATRREADRVTVDRREFENKAVRAAQQARAAENALEQHQQALITSRQSVATLTADLEQVDGILRELQQQGTALEAELSLDETRTLAILEVKEQTLDTNGNPTLTVAEMAQLKALREKKAAAIRRRELLASAPNVPLSNLDLAQTAIPIRRLSQSRDALRQQLNDAQTQVRQEEAIVRQLMATVQAERDQEISATEKWESLEQTERLKRDEQFRREVAARTEDPDTYVAGAPSSNDPVAQVSMAVVGEGLIQLRGPRKGVNEVHKMINEIDVPVGQVKVAIHTVQVNGEHGDRIEEVVYRIQCYLDHSRFLTMQSSQLLRNAVVVVASRRAEQVFAVCPPGMPQQDRDFRYQEAFFGEEFIQELRAMDSEFLRTGNKILSLHSMDTTSLSNALFLLALAKNDVRQEILAEFMTSVQHRLPEYELQFYQGSAPRPAWRDRTLAEKIKPGALREKHLPDFQLLGQNAQFASFRGFFDVQVAGPNTMTPMQRDFVQLAQIFKSRLITEVELRQRVMERSLIEERIGDYQASLAETAEKEKQALKKKEAARLAVLETAESVRASLANIHTTIDEISANAERIASEATLIGNATDEALNSLYTYVYIVKKASNSASTANLDKQATRKDWEDRFFSPSEFKDDLSPKRQLYEFLRPNPSAENLNLSTDKMNSLNDDLATGVLQTFIIDTNSVEKTAPPNPNGTSISPILIPFRLNDNRFAITITAGVTEATTSVSIDDPAGFSRFVEAYVTTLHEQTDQFNQFRLTPDYRTMLETATFYRAFSANNAHASNPKLPEKCVHVLVALKRASEIHARLARHVESRLQPLAGRMVEINRLFSEVAIAPTQFDDLSRTWGSFRTEALGWLDADAPKQLRENREENRYEAALRTLRTVDVELGLTGNGSNNSRFLDQIAAYRAASAAAENLRRPLDHKKFLDMLIDNAEEQYIELVEGTRAHIAKIDNYLHQLGTALEDDFNTQFYQPAFRHVREASYFYDVSVGQIETTSIVANNRAFAKVSPQATMEFDLPKRDILINEAANSALAAYNDYGALLNDPNFVSLLKLYGGQSPGNTFGGTGSPQIIRTLPGLPSGTDSQFMTSPSNNVPRIGSNLEALIPDPAVYKFETGTGYEIRPVIYPDGQAVVYHLNYLFTTNIREPVRADEKHLGRVRQHFIDTDVVSGNYELREVSTYRVALKAARSARGVPFLEDIPVAGVLFRPAVNAESSLQQNVILSQTVIYPTLFDLMGLRWAPAVAELDSLSLREREFVAGERERFLTNEVFDEASGQVDNFMRIEESRRRADLYRTQETIPHLHPNGYQGPGLNIQNGVLQEGYIPEQNQETTRFIPRLSQDADRPLEPAPRSPVYLTPALPVPVPVPADGVLIEGTVPDGGPHGLTGHLQNVQPMSWTTEPATATAEHRGNSGATGNGGAAATASRSGRATLDASTSPSGHRGSATTTSKPKAAGAPKAGSATKTRSLWGFPGLKR